MVDCSWLDEMGEVSWYSLHPKDRTGGPEAQASFMEMDEAAHQVSDS